MSMEVKVFAEGMVKEIKNYLPPEYADMECRVMEQKKNNSVSQPAICVGMPGEQVAALIGVEPYYEAARHGEPLSTVIENFTIAVQKSMARKELIELFKLDQYEAVKDHLTVRLVNTKANREMLSRTLHREVEDLSLILAVRFPVTEEQEGSIKVTQKIAEQWGVGQDLLFEQAWENMERGQEPVLQSLPTVVRDILNGMDLGETILMPESMEEGNQIYVLSNKEKMYGASVLFCPGVLEKVSHMVPEGFYILPSSVHEVLILPKGEDVSPKELGQMVRMVNQAEVKREEVLSDRVYEYDRERQTIRQVPESIERRREAER